MRALPTDAERRLWSKLRYGQLGGLKFRRQAPIGAYIADFVCFPIQLIIEVDGGQHATAERRDAARTAWLELQGFRVLRFWNNEVLSNTEGVLETIRNFVLKDSALERSKAPHPDPPPQGGWGQKRSGF
ncbi:MAG: endonuclease domain-containing protein [Alphaproteobacteria bacterium]|nr:endonuclease domain-containing protein [Alphaproteobacteria bacterium]